MAGPITPHSRLRTDAPLAAGTQERPWIPRSVILGAMGFCSNVSWQVVVPVLPLHLSHIGYTTAQIGVLISLISLAMGIVELQAGLIAAAVGRRGALIAGFSANAVGLVLAGNARTLSTVASALAGVGAAKGTVVPPLHATVAESSTAETRGRTFGIFWFLASTAALAGPAIGGLVAAKYGARAPFYLGAAFSAAALPIAAAVGVAGRPSPRASFTSIRELVRDAGILRLCAATLLCFGIMGIWMAFLPLYISRQGISVAIIGWVFTIQGCLYALMQIPTGRLVHRISQARLAVIGVAGIGGVVLLVPLLHTSSAFFGAAAVYGCAFGLIPVTFATLITRLVPSDKYTTAMGVYNSAIDLGLFVGPLLGGAAAAVLGPSAPFFVALPLGLAAVIVTLRTEGVERAFTQ